ncbi:MAG: hypothetical protein K0S61_4234 [Anaerocolumna sp.]|jgi:hypothetical protein|nr:hypothetical protein [Anaerocolumna sp.]
MKAYVKPTMEVIELRAEERLANCKVGSIKGKNLLTILLLRLLGSNCIPCTVTFVGSTCKS